MHARVDARYCLIDDGGLRLFSSFHHVCMRLAWSTEQPVALLQRVIDNGSVGGLALEATGAETREDGSPQDRSDAPLVLARNLLPPLMQAMMMCPLVIAKLVRRTTMMTTRWQVRGRAVRLPLTADVYIFLDKMAAMLISHASVRV